MMGDVARVLFGAHGMRQLALALNVNQREVRRWRAGAVDVPEEIWREVYGLLTERAHEVARLQHRVMKQIYREEPTL